MSYTNTDLKGYMPNSSLVKNIFNASGSVKSADKKLEAFTNITYLNTRAKGRSETGYGDNNVMQNAVTLNQGTRMGSGNEIFPGTSISTKPQDLKYRGETTTCIIGDNNSIRENVTISRGTASKGTTTVGSNNLLMENMHVAHDCVIGNSCIIGNSTKFAGEVVVDDFAIISAEVLIHQFCHIGGYVMVQGGSRTSQDIPPYVICGKEPIRFAGLNIVGLRRRGFSNDTITNIREAYRILYSKGILKEGIELIRENLEVTPEIQYIINFVETSQRGIIR